MRPVHWGTSAERGKPVVLLASYTKEEGKAHRKGSRRDSGYRRREKANAVL